MQAKILAALLLVLPAWLLMPLEQRIHTERARLKYGGAHVTRAARELMGQEAFIALLAGFRGVVADFVWIQSHGYWENREWLRQYRDIELATLLQPQSVLFWDTGAWHMAWNIAYGLRTDPANRTDAEGIKREREWQERARQFLLRGMENVPNRYDLYLALGMLYSQKLAKWQPNAYEQAAQYFALAASFENAPAYAGHEYAHALEKAGQRRAAYEFWKMQWVHHSRTNEMWNIVERETKRLERELKIPDKERVFPQSELPAAPHS